MEMSRTERRKASRDRSRAVRLVAATAAVLAVVAGGALAFSSALSGPDGLPQAEDPAEEEVSITLDETSTLETPQASPDVEVPDVGGKTLEEAQMLLAYAGLVSSSVEVTGETSGEPGTVLRQDPRAGSRVREGSEVVLAVVPTTMRQPLGTHLVVVIDPGHQARSNSNPEPIGPGSSITKERAQGGATGVTTRIPEYETVLQIGKVLAEVLRDAGVEVVMTRTNNDVDISNRQRAEVANQAGADLFVRIHCDGSGNPEVNGASTLYPAGNSWVAPIEARSKEAATLVQAALVSKTGAADLGLRPRADIAGFNWARVPSILVECGFLSNPVEDKLLSGSEYRREVAEGIADGVLEYLRGR